MESRIGESNLVKIPTKLTNTGRRAKLPPECVKRIAKECTILLGDRTVTPENRTCRLSADAYTSTYNTIVSSHSAHFALGYSQSTMEVTNLTTRGGWTDL